MLADQRVTKLCKEFVHLVEVLDKLCEDAERKYSLDLHDLRNDLWSVKHTASELIND